MDGAGLAPGASPAGNLPHGPRVHQRAPQVRIRREALQGGRTALVLCFKGAPDKTGLMREEIETEITPELFEKLERLIGKPLIAKERRTYALKNGLKLEVNDVDAGLPSHFMYAEVEYPDEPTARAWTPRRRCPDPLSL